MDTMNWTKSVFKPKDKERGQVFDHWWQTGKSIIEFQYI